MHRLFVLGALGLLWTGCFLIGMALYARLFEQPTS